MQRIQHRLGSLLWNRQALLGLEFFEPTLNLADTGDLLQRAAGDLASEVGALTAHGKAMGLNEGIGFDGSLELGARRHLCTMLALMPCDSATLATDTPGRAH